MTDPHPTSSPILDFTAANAQGIAMGMHLSDEEYESTTQRALEAQAQKAVAKERERTEETQRKLDRAEIAAQNEHRQCEIARTALNRVEATLAKVRMLCDAIDDVLAKESNKSGIPTFLSDRSVLNDPD